jgi:hypothetical protein
MKMHVLSGGRLRMRASIYFPEVPKEQTAEFPCSCFLIRHPQGNVLFDTGCHPAVETDAVARWGTLARAFAPVHQPGENVVGDLAKLTLRPDDIDVVINSHLHMDHCGCNEFFKKATFFIHAKELEVAADPQFEGKGYFRADWDHPMPIKTIDAPGTFLMTTGSSCFLCLVTRREVLERRSNSIAAAASSLLRMPPPSGKPWSAIIRLRIHGTHHCSVARSRSSVALRNRVARSCWAVTRHSGIP